MRSTGLKSRSRLPRSAQFKIHSYEECLLYDGIAFLTRAFVTSVWVASAGGASAFFAHGARGNADRNAFGADRVHLATDQGEVRGCEPDLESGPDQHRGIAR